jgi:Trypsin-like peptidase domain
VNKLLIPTLASYLLVIYGCVTGPNIRFISTIDQIKRSTVPIVCVSINPDKTWEVRSIEGSAFFITTDERFLTANHVLDAIDDPKRAEPCPLPALYLPTRGWKLGAANLEVEFFRFFLNRCIRTKEFDLAVCTLATPLKQIVPVVLEIAIQPEGTPVAFTGFPLSTPVPITSVGQIAGYTDVIEGRGPQRIVIDKGTGPRASGSPIYNLENGKVVGIMLQRGTGASAGLAFGITSQFIQDFLTNAKVVKENKPSQN